MDTAENLKTIFNDYFYVLTPLVILFITGIVLYVITHHDFFPSVYIFALPIFDIIQSATGMESLWKSMVLTVMAVLLLFLHFGTRKPESFHVDKIFILVFLFAGYLAMGSLRADDIPFSLALRKVVFVFARCVIPFLLAQALVYSFENIEKAYRGFLFCAVVCPLVLMFVAVAASEEERFSSTSGSIIATAQYACYYVILAVSRLLTKDASWVGKLILIASVFLNLLILILTASRGPFVALAFSLFLLVMSCGRLRISSIVKYATLTIVISVALFITLPGDKKHMIVERVSFSGKYADDYSNERYELYQLAWEKSKDRPFLGHGTASFTYYYVPRIGKEYIETRIYFPHNVFLELLYENGLVGCFLFAGLLVLTVWKSRTFYRNEYLSLNVRLTTLILAFSSFLMMQFSQHIASYPILWYAMGIISKSSAIVPQSPQRSPRPTASPPVIGRNPIPAADASSQNPDVGQNDKA